ASLAGAASASETKRIETLARTTNPAPGPPSSREAIGLGTPRLARRFETGPSVAPRVRRLSARGNTRTLRRESPGTARFPPPLPAAPIAASTFALPRCPANNTPAKALSHCRGNGPLRVRPGGSLLHLHLAALGGSHHARLIHRFNARRTHLKYARVHHL